MNFSDLLANFFKNNRINKVFCVTGGGAMFLNHSFSKKNKFNVTYMHHEQACAMAAEAYARITNKPAIVLLTTGPGVINSLNGVFGAFTDSIPMFVISGQVKNSLCLINYPNSNLRQLGDQEAKTQSLTQSIVKKYYYLKDCKNISYKINEAFVECTTGRPGPVWIDVPLDVQNKNITNLSQIKINKSVKKIKCKKSDINYVLKSINKAKRPLILAGTGVRLSKSIDLLKKIADILKIPVATAWTHDIFDNSSKLYAGRPGTIGNRDANLILQASDLLIVMGSRLNIRQTSYNFQSFASSSKIIYVDIDNSELDKSYLSIDKKIHSDLNYFLTEILKKLDSRNRLKISRNEWLEKIIFTKNKFSNLNEHIKINNKRNHINPYLFVNDVFNLLSKKDIVVCANASACIIPFQIGKLKNGMRLFSNSGSASMGYDLPASIGAALAEPSRRIICFAGDGSIQMNIQELQTIRSLNLNITIIVLNNNGYSSIAQTHKNFFGKEVGASPESGINFPNYLKVAKSYNISAYEIKNQNYFKKLSNYLKSSGPLLLNVYTDPKQEFIPKLKSKQDQSGNFVTPELDDMYPFLNKDELCKIRKYLIS